jgi:hypothetical protein
VPQYRAYPVNAAPRPGAPHIAAPPHIIECDNDDQAIGQARQLVDGHDIELWEGARFVIGIKRTDAK